MSRDIDEAWTEVAHIQQAGLDTALAKSKSRKPKASKSAPTDSTAAANGALSHPHDSNGNMEGSSGLPNQDITSGAGTGQGAEQTEMSPDAQDNAHLASEENQAANRQMPGPSSVATSSMGKSQVSLHNCLSARVFLSFYHNHRDLAEL